MPTANYAIIILAAGSSSRLGSSKQLLEINGEKLLEKTVKLALASNADHVVVVLGANATTHEESISKMGTDIIVNEFWQRGIGSSLKCGVSFVLKKNPDAQGVIVLVCDQPLLSTDHINSLINHHQQVKKPIIASYYQGTAGVPALFTKEHFNAILTLADHEGAKKIILQHSEAVSTVNFPGGEIDIDTMEDYASFTADQ